MPSVETYLEYLWGPDGPPGTFGFRITFVICVTDVYIILVLVFFGNSKLN